MKEIRIMDTTLRDAHQSLWATRMTTAMMLSVAERMDRIGFDGIELMAMIQFDVCVRYLKENPWERLRLMRRKITRTPLQGMIRSKTLTGFDIVPNDLRLLWADRLVANGIRIIGIFDALADLDNIVYVLQHAKKLGAYTVGTLVYGHSPVHTDELYRNKSKELIERADVDAVKLKDPCGLLTPDRIRTIVPAMKSVMGSVPLEVHCHSLTGLAPLVYLEAAKLGADQVQCAIAPLAHGPSQPATQTTARNLREMGFEVNLDDALIDEVSAQLRKIAEQEGKPLGAPMEYDAFHFEHQVPGGMITNFKSQLAQAGLSHKLTDILHECAQIRRELGWPIMVTPFSQFVGTQAVLNVVNGERYKVVSNEVKKYALGHYGKLLAPVEPNVLDHIVENGSQEIPLVPKPLEPAIPALRKKFPDASDEERLLRYSYAGNQVDEMLASGPMKTEYHFEQPLVRLLNEITKRSKFKHIYIKSKELCLELNSKTRDLQFGDKTRRRDMIRAGTLAACAAFSIMMLDSTAEGRAQAYPHKPVRMILPFAPGGGTDILGRLIGQKLSDLWDVPVVFDNRPGAGSTVGTGLTAKAAPDGYTLGVTSMSHAINATLYRALPYDTIKDFAPIILTVRAPNVLVVHPSVAAHSVKELIALAKSQPGRLNFSSSGTGGVSHLSAEVFRAAAGIDIVHVPYKGAGPAMVALVGGEAQLMMATMPVLLPQMKANRVRPLAISSLKRSPLAPELPTIAESGFPGFETDTWYGLLAPAGTPAAIVQRVNADTARVMELPDLKAALEKQGAQPAGGTPEEFLRFIQTEIAKWRKAIIAAKVPPAN